MMMTMQRLTLTLSLLFICSTSNAVVETFSYDTSSSGSFGGELRSANPTSHYALSSGSAIMDQLGVFRHTVVPFTIPQGSIPDNSVINSVILVLTQASATNQNDDVGVREILYARGTSISDGVDAIWSPSWNTYDFGSGTSSWDDNSITSSAHLGGTDTGSLLDSVNIDVVGTDTYNLDVSTSMPTTWNDVDFDITFLCYIIGTNVICYLSNYQLQVNYTAPTPTPTATRTPTNTGQPTATFTNTPTNTHTPTVTNTPTPTFTPSNTSVATPTFTAEWASQYGHTNYNKAVLSRGVLGIVEGIRVLDNNTSQSSDSGYEILDRSNASTTNFQNALDNSSIHTAVTGWTPNANADVVYNTTSAFDPSNSGSLEIIATAANGSAYRTLTFEASNSCRMVFGYMYSVTAETTFVTNVYAGHEVNSATVQMATSATDVWRLQSLVFDVDAGDSVTRVEVLLPFSGSSILLDNIGLYDANHWPGYIPNLDDVAAEISMASATIGTLTLSSMTTGSVPFVGVSDVLTEDNTNLFFNNTSNRLGVGTAAPDYALDVEGDVGISEYLYHNGDADTFTRFTDDEYTLQAGGVTGFKFTETTQDLISIGQTASDVDTRVMTVGSDSTLFIKGSDGNIGIGTNDVEDWNTSYRALENPSGSLMLATAGAGSVHFNSNAYLNTGASWLFKAVGRASNYYQNAGTHNFRTSTSSGSADGAITWTDEMTIDTSGNVSIGPDTTPSARLHVSSDTTNTPALDDDVIGLFENSAGDSEVSIMADVAGISVLNLGNDADEDEAFIQYNSGTNLFTLVLNSGTCYQGTASLNQWRYASEFNYNNEDRDFMVNGDTSDNVLFVDATTASEYVGIRTGAPEAPLHVVGIQGTNPTFSNQAIFENTNTTGTSCTINVCSGNAATAGIYLSDQNDADVASVLYNNSTNAMTFETNDVTAMTIDSDQDLAIVGDLSADGNTTFGGSSAFDVTTQTQLSGAGPHAIDTTDRYYIKVSRAIGTTGNMQLDAGVAGQQIILQQINSSGTATMSDDAANTDTGNVRLSAAWTPDQYDTLTLFFEGTDWIEIARSTN